jgi:RNA polymerase-binding transcription factor DksA
MPAAKKASAKKATAAAPATAAKTPARKAATVKRSPSTRAASAKAAAKKDMTPVKKDDASATGDTGAKPVFDAKFLEEQRVLLLEERATYLRQAETLQAEADSLAELREPGDVQFDEESGEGDTLAVERERDLALSARARQEIEEIDRALEKITKGTYGICEVSGEPIPRARLQAIPQARERVEYKVGGFRR